MVPIFGNAIGLGFLVVAWGLAIALPIFGIAAIVRAWRSGSSDRSIDRAIRDARRDAFKRGYDGH